LAEAIYYERHEHVEILVESGVDINEPVKLYPGDQDQTPLYRAVYNQSKSMASHLLALGADVNARQPYSFTTALHFAVRGSLEIARLLLQANADVNAKDRGA